MNHNRFGFMKIALALGLSLVLVLGIGLAAGAKDTQEDAAPWQALMDITVSAKDGAPLATSTLTLSASKALSPQTGSETAQTHRKGAEGLLEMAVVNAYLEGNDASDIQVSLASPLVSADNEPFAFDEAGVYTIAATDGEQTLTFPITIWDETLMADNIIIDTAEVDTLDDDSLVAMANAAARHFDGESADGADVAVSVDRSALKAEPGTYQLVFRTESGTERASMVKVIASSNVIILDTAVPLAGPELDESMEATMEAVQEAAPIPAEETTEPETYMEAFPPEVTYSDTTESTFIDESTTRTWHRVTYLDADGYELMVLDVSTGYIAEQPEFIIAPAGTVFSHWYDEMQLFPEEPFDFAWGIYADYVLRPYFIQVGQIVDLIPEEALQPVDMMPEPAAIDEAAMARSILGGSEEAGQVIDTGILPDTDILPDAPDMSDTVQEVSPYDLAAGILGDTQADLAETDADRVPEASISCTYDGELMIGTEVTLEAFLDYEPTDMQVHYQWQNDASGEFIDVPGATGRTHVFNADTTNCNCTWRVRITLNN